MSIKLELAGQEVERRLNQIARVFKPGVKLTLLARTPGNDEADFLMTADQPGDIRSALDRRFGRVSCGEPIPQAVSDKAVSHACSCESEIKTGWTTENAIPLCNVCGMVDVNAAFDMSKEQSRSPHVPEGMALVPVVGKDSFVQLVPDHCDRIVWRGSYHHLPLAATKKKGE